MILYLVNVGQEVSAYKAKHWRELARLDEDLIFINMFSDSGRYFVASRGTRLKRRDYEYQRPL